MGKLARDDIMWHTLRISRLFCIFSAIAPVRNKQEIIHETWRNKIMDLRWKKLDIFEQLPAQAIILDATLYPSIDNVAISCSSEEANIIFCPKFEVLYYLNIYNDLLSPLLSFLLSIFHFLE